MKNLLPGSVLSLMLAFVFTIGIGSFTDSHAWEKRRNPTQSGIKATGKIRKETATARWNSLSPEQQAYYGEKAKTRASKAKMTSQEYWNSLSPEQQQEATERSRARATNARKRWQNLPE